MIEIIENAIQLITTGICTVIAVQKGIRLQSRAWSILALASGVFFLGDLYWELFLVLYSKTPGYSYIPYLSWYAAYLFLLLLLFELKGTQNSGKQRKILWFIPVFSAGMCVFYMQFGDWIGNIITAVFMSLLMWHALDMLLYLRDVRSVSRGTGDEIQTTDPVRRCEKGWIFAAVLLFCVAEYAAWTASCFGTYDTLAHPYFWFDTLLSLVFLLFPAALGKAVDR